MLASCSLFQMGGSKKWECVSYGKMELCRGKAACSRPRSLRVCLTAPWQMQRLLQTHFDRTGGGGTRPQTARSENSPLSHKSANLSDSTAHLSQRLCYKGFLLLFFCLWIQEGCQDTEKVRLPQVYHFCNVFKQTVKAMRS